MTKSYDESVRNFQAQTMPAVDSSVLFPINWNKMVHLKIYEPWNGEGKVNEN